MNLKSDAKLGRKSADSKKMAEIWRTKPNTLKISKIKTFWNIRYFRLFFCKGTYNPCESININNI